MSSGSRPEPEYPISSVDNALVLLKMLKDSPQIRVVDAARTLGVSASTAHRLLAMLAFHGFVVQDKTTRAYGAGPTFLELGLAALKRGGLVAQARPIIESLRDRLQETVSVAVLDGPEVLVIDAVQPDRIVRVAPRVGHRSPAHWNASGKALLADLDDAQIREIFPRSRLPTATSRTLKSRRALIEHCHQVRDTGYATNLGEFEEEMGAVGTVIRDGRGDATAAIAVTALLSRIEPRISEVAKLLRETALEIEAALV